MNWSLGQALTTFPKRFKEGRTRFFGTTLNGAFTTQRAGNQNTDFVDYQFCHDDSLDRYDSDGQMDVPPMVCQYYLLQGAIGVIIAGLDWVVWHRECYNLASTPDQEAFGPSPLADILTIVNVAAVTYHCPQGGRVYLHIWFDGQCNCKHNYVIICNSCPSGA